MADIKRRKHPVYIARMVQIMRNRLAVDGGRPYIDARLHRAPNETDVSWYGSVEDGIVGRKDRACLVNDAGRIASKINQYLFKTKAQRDGADEKFISNVTGEGMSVDDFMDSVSTALTTAGWCWLQVDRAPQKLDKSGNLISYTIETAKENPVMWRLWEALDVTDWNIDDNGEIRWLVTRSFKRIDGNPDADPKDTEIYTLYHRDDDGNVYVTERSTKKVPELVLRDRQVVPGLDRIPFVLVGRVSARPWWFDDVENIQCQILNLDSLHNETLTDGVYPQLVVPRSILQSLDVELKLEKTHGKDRIKLQRELIKGRNSPLYEDGEEKGVTRYIQPNAGDLAQIVNEANRKRGLLFDMSGLALFNKETRQIQTAESKQFDQLDTSSTLGNRALILQHAEQKLVDLSARFDSTFSTWKPVYPTKFDVVDVQALSDSLGTVSNLPDVPPAMRKIVLKAALRIVREIGGCDDETFDKAVAVIDAMPDKEENPPPSPYGKNGKPGAKEEDEE